MGENHPAMWSGDGSTGVPTSIPLLSMAYRSIGRHLISRAPRILATIADKKLKTWVENQEIATNKRIMRSNVDREFSECAYQSLCSFGTMFMGPCYVGTPSGMKLDLEIKAIDRSDFFYDTEADRIEDADLQGHEFDMPLQDVREHPLFDPDCREQVTADGTDESTSEMKANLRKDSTRPRDMYDYVRIRFVYEKRRNMIYYYPKHQPELKLLETEWLGPRHGPYRYLYFEKFPGNATPMAPLAHLLKKHRSFNMLDVKTIHQQQVEKGLLMYTNASKEEAKAVLNAMDLQSVLRENGAYAWTHVGGASPDSVSMAMKQRSDFNYATGGIVESFMAQADTLGQERLLRGSANEMLDDLSATALRFVKGVCEDIFWFDLRDPDDNPQILWKQIPGREEYYPVEWTKDHRRFVMEMDYEVDVEPFSYVDRTPAARLADFMGGLQIIQGFGEQAMAQGILIDVEAVARLIAKYKNLPELHDVLVLNQDPKKLAELLSPRTNASPTDPAKPNGRYKRESTSDGAGAEMEMIRAMGRGQQAQGMQAK